MPRHRSRAGVGQRRTWPLDSFAVHASSSPLLLVSTRKDEALSGGGGGKKSESAVLAALDDTLRSSLSEARLQSVVSNGKLCFSACIAILACYRTSRPKTQPRVDSMVWDCTYEARQHSNAIRRDAGKNFRSAVQPLHTRGFDS